MKTALALTPPRPRRMAAAALLLVLALGVAQAAPPAAPVTVPDPPSSRQQWQLLLQAPPLPPGQRYALRGSAPPLSWERGLPLTAGQPLALAWEGRSGQPLEAKFVVEDDAGQVLRWERGSNRRWAAGAPPGSMRFDLTAEAERAWRAVEAADAAAFAAANARDVGTLARFFSPRLEFFHDTGGLSDAARNLSQLTQMLARPDVRVRRELVEHQVYPVPGVGAMQIGRHRFCSRERAAGGEFGAEGCSVYGFSTVWEETPAGWQMLRVLSYGH